MLTARVRTLAPSSAGKNRTRRRPGTFHSTNVVAAVASSSSSSSSSSPPPPNNERPKKQAVTLAWVSADGKLRAEVETFAGEDLLAAATAAAEAAGDEPPAAGCYSGSCGLCELTLRRLSGGRGGGLDGAPAVVRSCITAVPAGYGLVEVSPLPEDAIWGVDAWDT